MHILASHWHIYDTYYYQFQSFEITVDSELHKKSARPLTSPQTRTTHHQTNCTTNMNNNATTWVFNTPEGHGTTASIFRTPPTEPRSPAHAVHDAQVHVADNVVVDDPVGADVSTTSDITTNNTRRRIIF